jgi:hypothetical protein
MAVSLVEAVGRTLADGVATAAEVRSVASRTDAKKDPKAVIDAYQVDAGKLTNRATDIILAAKAALETADGTVKASDILTGKTMAAPIIPVWAKDFDYAGAAERLKVWLVSRGVDPATIGPGTATKLVFSDFDLTLSKTSTPTYLRDVDTKRLLCDAQGKLVKLGTGPTRDFEADLEKLKHTHPEYPFAKLEPVFDDFNSGHDMARTEIIPENVGELIKADKDPDARVFLITARSGKYTADFTTDYLMAHGLKLDGSIAVNEPEMAEILGVTAIASSSKRKALAMGVVNTLFGGQELVKENTFTDETDKNQRTAIELLPKLFPKILQRFVDVLHTGELSFKRQPLARTSTDGELVWPSGHKFSQADLIAYKGVEEPIPTHPVF